MISNDDSIDQLADAAYLITVCKLHNKETKYKI